MCDDLPAHIFIEIASDPLRFQSGMARDCIDEAARYLQSALEMLGDRGTKISGSARKTGLRNTTGLLQAAWGKRGNGRGWSRPTRCPDIAS
jgi:hypothetical protein